MAVAESNSYLITADSVSSLTQTNVVVASGEGLVVLVHTSDASGTAQTITGCTWNGGAMTQHSSSVLTASDGNSNVHRHAAFYLPSPTATTASVVASFGGSAVRSGLAVFVVSGHDTAAMIDDWIASAVGGGTVPTTTVAGSTTDGMVFDLLRWRSSSSTPPSNGPGTGQTLLDDVQGGNWFYRTSKESATGANTVMSWVDASDSAWNLQAIAVKASSGPAQSQAPRSMHILNLMRK